MSVDKLGPAHRSTRSTALGRRRFRSNLFVADEAPRRETNSARPDWHAAINKIANIIRHLPPADSTPNAQS
jgi:hypothetical protein